MAEYIEREAAINLINRMAEGCTYLDITAEEVIDGISAIPAADVRENKRGYNTGEDRIFHCSECGYGLLDIYLSDEAHFGDINYCPNCGASMSPSVKQIVCSQCGGTRFTSHGEEVRCSNCGADMRGEANG